MIEARAPQHLQNPDAQQGRIPDTDGLPVNGLRDALHATLSPELTRVDIIQRAESVLGLQVADMLISRAGRVDPDGTPWTSTEALLDPAKVTRGTVMKLTDDRKGAYNYAEYTFSPAFLPPDAAVQFNKLTAQIEETKRLATERGIHTGRRDFPREQLAAILEKQRQELVAGGVKANFGASGDDPPTPGQPETAPLAVDGLFATVSTLSTAAQVGSKPTRSRRNRTLAVGAAATAAAFLSACGGAGPKAPDATPRVTTYPTATLVLPTPTEVPPTATFTAIPPTATPEPSPTVRPRPTPDKSISPVKIEPNLMAQELTKTAAGQVLLNRIDDLAKEIGSTRANVLTYLDVSYSTDPATGQVKYAFANVRPGGGFGPLSTTVGLDSGAFVAGDLKFESKQEDLLNNQYPKMDVDGKRLIVSTGLASSVAGVHVKEIKPDVFKRKFVAYGDDGSIVAEASMDIDSSPVKSKEKGSEGKPLPDWKAVIGFLPPTPVVVGEIFTGTAQPAKTATAEAQVTPEVKRMQAMGFTENVSVLPNEYFSNTKPLIDALRRSNPEAEKLMNDYFVSALTALIDHNPTPSASRIAEVQTKLAAARKDGKPFLVEENLQEVAGWDSEGKPLFPTPSEQAAKPYKIDFSKPVIMTFETEKDLEMRLKRGGTGSVDSTIRTAIDPKNGQLYIGVLDAPGLVDSSISAFDGNRNLALAFNTLAQPAVSLYWASDSSASKAPLVSIPKGFTNRGQAPVVAWNRAHGNDFDTKR